MSSPLPTFESHRRMCPSEIDLNSSTVRVLTWNLSPLPEESSPPSEFEEWDESLTCSASALSSFSRISALKFCCLRILTPKSILSSRFGSPRSRPKSVRDPPPSLSFILALRWRMFEKNCL